MTPTFAPRDWQVDGLPADAVSTENGIILACARRWPLAIDPQGQANKWIKNMEADNQIEACKPSDRDFLRSLENAVRFGKPVVMENVGESLDPALEPILLKQTFKQGGNIVMKIGDNVIPYHVDFRFFMTSKLPNPHYTPETSVKVTLLNFTITQEGLEDQLLGITVAKERPDLEVHSPLSQQSPLNVGICTGRAAPRKAHVCPLRSSRLAGDQEQPGGVERADGGPAEGHRVADPQVALRVAGQHPRRREPHQHASTVTTTRPEPTVRIRIGQPAEVALVNRAAMLSALCAAGRSKVTSNEIEIKAAEAAETEIVIDRTREEYRPVAFHAALLFFCVADMGSVNDMYQYSMPWFVQLFVKAIEDSEKTDVITDRLKILADFCERRRIRTSVAHCAAAWRVAAVRCRHSLSLDAPRCRQSPTCSTRTSAARSSRRTRCSSRLPSASRLCRART